VPAPLDPLDWFARWRAMVRRREAQVEALTDRPPPEDYWGRRATCFHQQTRAAADLPPDPFLTLVLARVDAAATVLDVGAGAGRHTLPLARRARRVRALEPSEAMRGFLEEEIAARRLTNVEVIARAWPADGIEAADVVICAHVLYPIAELEPFLRGLDDAARRACFLLLRSDLPVWEGYWPRVRGQDRLPEPGLVEAYNVCCQMGLRPNVTMFEAEMTMEWRSAEEALRDLATRLFMAESSPLYPRLREVVTQDLHPTGGGCGIGPYRTRLGVLWWEKPTPSLQT
jgi:SAM-dependent methyltransferase